MTKTPDWDRNGDMDALSDVLRVAHLTGGVYLHADFFAPWCLAARVSPEHCMPALGRPSHLIIYHYVIEGEFHIRVDGGDTEDFIIGAGEVVLLPRNDLHLMGSDLSLPPVTGAEIIHLPKDGGLYSIHHGGAGSRTRMVCGFLGCDNAESNPVISTLPPLLKLNFEQGGPAEWIRSTFQYAAEEIAAGRPRSETVLAKRVGIRCASVLTWSARNPHRAICRRHPRRSYPVHDVRHAWPRPDVMALIAAYGAKVTRARRQDRLHPQRVQLLMERPLFEQPRAGAPGKAPHCVEQNELRATQSARD
jgi:Cupin